MSKGEQNSGISQWLQRIGGWVTGAIGFVTVVLSFVQLAQGNSGLLTLILLYLGIGLVLATCFYYAVLWRPEKQDGESRLILATTMRSEQMQGQKPRRQWVRRIAITGLILVPLLMLSSYASWQYVQSLPNDEVVILVAEFDGKEPQTYRVTDTILRRLKDVTKEYEDVRVEALDKVIREQEGSEAARAIGAKQKAAIVIWGWYGTTNVAPISVNFEVLQPSEYLPKFGDLVNGKVQTFALSDLESFQLQMRLSSKMNYLTLFTLGMAEYAAEDWKSAIAMFDMALLHVNDVLESPDSAFIFFFKGNSLVYNGQHEKAVGVYNAALEISLDHEALNNKGYALRELGKYEEAVAACDMALSIKSDYYEALINKGLALHDLGKYEEAIVVYDMALETKPNLYEALYNKGNTLYELGRYEEAIAIYDMALEVKPKSYEVLYNKAYVLHEIGRYREAVAVYTAALKANPDSHEAFYNKGNALYELGKYKQAIAAYAAALRIKPDKYNALYNKGVLLLRIEQHRAAIATFNIAAEIQPEDPRNYYNLVQCYVSLNQTSRALENIEKLTKLKLEVGRETIATSPDFDNLRNSPRFKALIAPN